MNKYIVFGRPNLGEEEKIEILESLESGWLGTGPKVKKFESDFAAYKGIEHSIALNSATAGLHLSCIALNLNPGDEVITTSMTFCSTINSIIHAGAKPVLVDIDKQTWNIDVNKIEEKITSRTRAIMPVHFAGRCCEMDEILKIAESYKLRIIEDCAHAIETEYKGKKAGTFGDFGVFSFYSTKNLAVGEGGMVISKNKKAVSKIKNMALHGMSRDAWKRFSDQGYKHYDVEDAGFKYNMTDLSASIGIHQLKKIEKFYIRREKIWNLYMAEFEKLPVRLPSYIDPSSRHAYHLFNICIDESASGINRDKFLNLMNDNKIGVGVHYQSIPTHSYYMKNYKWNPDDFPIAKKFGQETVSLPLGSNLSDEDLDRIIETVKSILS